MSLYKVKCKRGTLGKFCAAWDRVLCRLIMPPPADFVLTSFLKEVQDEDCMTSIMVHGRNMRDWTDPGEQQAIATYQWLRDEICLQPSADRKRMAHDERGERFGGRRILERLRRPKIFEAVAPRLVLPGSWILTVKIRVGTTFCLL